MRNHILIWAFLLLLPNLFANTYFFSSSNGDDSYSAEQARNSNTAWRSIEKLNSAMELFRPGDSILFNRGDKFVGQLSISCSGNSLNDIYFGAYGSGEKPVLSALVDVNNWTETNPQIWVADVSMLSLESNLLLINGKTQQVGRYPNVDNENKGYLDIESHTGRTIISNSSLINAPNFAGAEVIIRTRRWFFDRSNILTHSGGTLAVDKPTRYDIIDGFGFFVQNHLATLDQNGEWFHDSGSSRLYLYSTENPNNMEVQLSFYPTVLNISDQGYLTFRDLEMEGASSMTVFAESSTYVSIENCLITNSGRNGAVFQRCSEINVQNSGIHNSMNNALEFTSCDHVNIRDNDIFGVGMIMGMGQGSNYQYTGIFFSGTNYLCEFNSVEDIGYNGIQFLGDFITIRNNLVKDFCMTLDDGGGIYTVGDGESISQDRVISGNIVLNGIGTGEGATYPSEVYASGIYIDERTNDFMIESNTIANCSDNGIFVHNASDFTIIGNTCYNNDNQLGFSHDPLFADYPIFEGRILDNIFYAKLPDQSLAEFLTIHRYEVNSFGVFDRNYYCRPTGEENTIKLWIHEENPIQFELLNLKEWKSKFQHDMNSEITKYEIPSFSIVSESGTNLVENGNFDQDLHTWQCWSSSSSCSLNWSDNNGLNGGNMHISSSSAFNNNGFLQATGASRELVKGANYILRFSALASNPTKYLRCELKNVSAPYETISNTVQADIANYRKDFELLFFSLEEVSTSTINFLADEDGTEYWIDNIELIRADVDLKNTLDSIVFVYNATREELVLNDGIDYIDIEGIKVEPVILEPYSSQILLKVKQDSSVRVQEISPKVFLSFKPNPVDQIIYCHTNDHSRKQIKLFDQQGRLILERQSSSASYSIDLSNIPQGLYILSQEGENSLISTKLIIK